MSDEKIHQTIPDVDGTEPRPNTDGAAPDVVLRAILQCAQSWEGGARLLGNVRAVDIELAVIAALVALGGPPPWSQPPLVDVCKCGRAKDSIWHYFTDQPGPDDLGAHRFEFAKAGPELEWRSSLVGSHGTQVLSDSGLVGTERSAKEQILTSDPDLSSWVPPPVVAPARSIAEARQAFEARIDQIRDGNIMVLDVGEPTTDALLDTLLAAVRDEQAQEIAGDDLAVVMRAIRPLDSGALHCRYCRAGQNNQWEHDEHCAYEQSVKDAEKARHIIASLRVKQAEAQGAERRAPEDAYNPDRPFDYDPMAERRAQTEQLKVEFNLRIMRFNHDSRILILQALDAALDALSSHGAARVDIENVQVQEKKDL